MEKTIEDIVRHCKKLQINSCSSMYPAAIINRQLFPEHLGVEWYEGIKWAYNERVSKWKPLSKKGDVTAKVWSDGLKLMMNGGGFGKTNEEFSWQYDPKVTFSITLNNQFALMMLTEWLMMADITVLSVNTDGILCRVKNSQESIYYEIMKKWEDVTKFEMEYDPFELFVQRSISDYLAKKQNGGVKYKGDFEIHKECHKNKSNRIVPIALKNYFIDDIPVEDTIRNHDNIFDFTIGRRARGSFRFFAELPGKHRKLPKTIRYIVTKDGWYFFKMEGKRRKHLEAPTKISRKIRGVSAFKKSWRCTLLNDAREYSMDSIDYAYYLHNTNSIINEIEIKDQLSLF